MPFEMFVAVLHVLWASAKKEPKYRFLASYSQLLNSLTPKHDNMTGC